jgi:hydrogenase maturation protease
VSGRILIAGIGNIFLGDDGFGVEVAQRLSRRTLPEGVRVVDFGIRGVDLTYALLEEPDAVILVDATPRGGQPGTLYVLEPEPAASANSADAGLLVETHNLDPGRVLRLVAALGGRVRRLLVVGCEPGQPEGEEEMAMGLSAAVEAAVDEAVLLIESLVTRIVQGLDVGGICTNYRSR